VAAALRAGVKRKLIENIEAWWKDLSKAWGGANSIWECIVGVN